MEESEHFSVGKTSKINSGMLQVFRLDFLWKEANNCAMVGKYSRWNNILDRVWCELVGDVSNQKDIDKFNELNKEYAKTVSIINLNGFKKYPQADLKKFVGQKEALMKKESFLRSLQNVQGKGTAYDEDDDDFE